MGSVEAGCEGSWLPHPEEQLFLDQLFTFMDRQGSPIHKVPNLGFKKSESLYSSFFQFSVFFFFISVVCLFLFFLSLSYLPSLLPTFVLSFCPSSFPSFFRPPFFLSFFLSCLTFEKHQRSISFPSCTLLLAKSTSSDSSEYILL